MSALQQILQGMGSVLTLASVKPQPYPKSSPQDDAKKLAYDLKNASRTYKESHREQAKT